MDHRAYAPAVDKILDLISGILIGLRDELMNDGIRAGVTPIGHRERVCACPCVLYIVQNAPRVVNLRIAKEVAIIPFFDNSSISF